MHLGLEKAQEKWKTNGSSRWEGERCGSQSDSEEEDQQRDVEMKSQG